MGPRRLSKLFALALSIVCASTAVAQASAPSSLLIRGGRLLDGTGRPAQRLDVRVVGDSIAEVGRNLRPRSGERFIDATGRTVTPGFIDLHSHAGGGIAEMPDAESQVRQGITTAVVGQDGGSELPVSDFFALIQRARPAINFATLVGHGTVRNVVLGGDYRRPATPAEIEAMKVLVHRAMLDGALGLSSGLEYNPGSYAETPELVALASVVKPHGGFYASHVRDEENKTLESWSEAIAIGEKSGIPVLISHLKLASRPVWGRAAEGLKLLEEANRRGVQVWGDWYPYTFWSSSIYVMIPGRDWENRQEWETGLAEVGGPQNVLVVGYPDSSYNRKTVAELASAKGTDPVSLIIDMIRTAGPGIRVIVTAMDEPDLRTFAAHPLVMISSDGAIRSGHPRAYGAFPRVLARYVRETGVLPLPEAIAKMTGRSAKLLGFADRGTIAPGKKADLLVFDPARVQDHATQLNPTALSTGIDYVIVNGQIVLDAGKLTGNRPGRALRRR